jgi:hypothetical protein
MLTHYLLGADCYHMGRRVEVYGKQNGQIWLRSRLDAGRVGAYFKFKGTQVNFLGIIAVFSF